MDIIYALGSVNKNQAPLFEIQQNITKIIVQQQNSPETKHGLIVFGKDAKEVSPLEDFNNEPEFVEKLMDLKWPSGAKSLAPPFEKSSQIFKEQGNAKIHSYDKTSEVLTAINYHPIKSKDSMNLITYSSEMLIIPHCVILNTSPTFIYICRFEI